MARGKRKVPDINSSSTADIAFLLLIFFLITTSMDTDRGLARLLPPPPEDEKNENTDKIKECNILQVYLNKDDALMCGNDYIGVEQLREKAKEFIHENIISKLPLILAEESWRDPKSHLQEVAQRIDNHTPQYRVLSESGPDHDKTFEIAVFVNGVERGRGVGSSKQAAQQESAKDALHNYGV